MEKLARRLQLSLVLLPFLDPVFLALVPFLKLLVHSAFFLLSAFVLSLAAPICFLLSVQFVSDLHLKDKEIMSNFPHQSFKQEPLLRLGETA